MVTPASPAETLLQTAAQQAAANAADLETLADASVTGLLQQRYRVHAARARGRQAELQAALRILQSAHQAAHTVRLSPYKSFETGTRP